MEFDTEFGYYDFINIYYEEDDEFFSSQVGEEKEQCLKENYEKKNPFQTLLSQIMGYSFKKWRI